MESLSFVKGLYISQEEIEIYVYKVESVEWDQITAFIGEGSSKSMFNVIFILLLSPVFHRLYGWEIEALSCPAQRL